MWIITSRRRLLFHFVFLEGHHEFFYLNAHLVQLGIQELHNALHDLLENTRHMQVQTLALIAKQILAPHQAAPIVYVMGILRDKHLHCMRSWKIQRQHRYTRLYNLFN